jgi:hypothetical protein
MTNGIFGVEELGRWRGRGMQMEASGDFAGEEGLEAIEVLFVGGVADGA